MHLYPLVQFCAFVSPVLRQVFDRMDLFQLRLVLSQVRRKNKDAPNLGHPGLVQD